MSHPLDMGLVVALAIVESGVWMGGLAVMAGWLRRKRDMWYAGHWLLVVMSVTSVLDISTAYLLAGFPVEWRVAGILGLAAIGALVSIAPVTTGSPIGAWRTLFYVLALVNLAPFVYLAGTRVPVLMGWMFMFRWLQLIVPLALCIALALGDRRAPAGSWPHRFGVWMFTVRQVMQVVVYVRWGWY